MHKIRLFFKHNDVGEERFYQPRAHMHALKISMDNKDSITHTWTLYEKGKKKSDVVIKLVRTKA